jgi:hypothetical protein
VAAENLDVSSTRSCAATGCKSAARIVLTRVTLAGTPNRWAHYCLKHTRAVLAQARVGLMVRDMRGFTPPHPPRRRPLLEWPSDKLLQLSLGERP